MAWYHDIERSTPRSTDEGIKARSTRGAFVENWWATRWIDALEQLMNPGRLRRGKRYARKGQVIALEEAGDGPDKRVAARVQGSRAQPYNVEIRLEPPSEADWAAVLDALAGRALFTADLLAGQMPPDIEEAFANAGVPLFPEAGGDLHASCSCPDWAEICKHIAATHYILGERFDEDPFLLFRLRGRTREQILHALRARRGIDAGAEGDARDDDAGGLSEREDAPADAQTQAPSLKASMTDYWRGGDAIDTLTTRIEAPDTPMPVLQRLGPPTFSDDDFTTLLAPIYKATSEAALAAAFQEPSADEPADEPPMELEPRLYNYTNRKLKKLIRVTGDGAPSRKDELVGHLVDLLTTPASLHEKVWAPMDALSKKAVSSAYHNDGLFRADAFAAQYGDLPERPRKHQWDYRGQPILMDLLIHDGENGSEIPSDLMPLLADRVASPDPFRLTGPEDAPDAVTVDGEERLLTQLDTEKTGLSDLLAYLHMVDQNDIRLTKAGRRIKAASARKVLPNLADGDFFALPDEPYAADTFRPFALDVFTQESGLVSSTTSPFLTEQGRGLWKKREPEALLEAFETWTHESAFDELSRIPEISGQEAAQTELTPPARRREQIVEALSWCPAGVWISLEDFLRALLIWHFDFDVEETDHSNLKIGSAIRYGAHWVGGEYWRVVNGLYVQVVLWEYLGTIGALDLLYLPAEESDLSVQSFGRYQGPFSSYDGLTHFRINDLGAYLLGQAPDYQPLRPSEDTLFSIDSGRTLTLHAPPDALTPHLRLQLDLVAEPAEGDQQQQYHLTSERLLGALENGRDWDELTGFLARYHDGPLPDAVTDWLERLQENIGLFERGRRALFIKVKRKALADRVLDDEVIGRFAHRKSPRTLVIPSSREKRFRERLRELEYVLC